LAARNFEKMGDRAASLEGSRLGKGIVFVQKRRSGISLGYMRRKGAPKKLLRSPECLRYKIPKPRYWPIYNPWLRE
jgi:hypothetical protein